MYRRAKDSTGGAEGLSRRIVQSVLSQSRVFFIIEGTAQRDDLCHSGEIVAFISMRGWT